MESSNSETSPKIVIYEKTDGHDVFADELCNIWGRNLFRQLGQFTAVDSSSKSRNLVCSILVMPLSREPFVEHCNVVSSTSCFRFASPSRRSKVTFSSMVRILQMFPRIWLPEGVHTDPTGKARQLLTGLVTSAEGCKVVLT